MAEPPSIACLDIPALPLQWLLRRHPDWASHPAVVVDRDKPQGKILWVNATAHRLRILPGMRYAAGQSLTRELRAGVVAPAEIASAVAELVTRLRTFTPDVEAASADTDPGVFWLGVRGLSLLYPSLERWGQRLHHDLAQQGWLGSIAMGFSRFGTYALARARPGLVVLTSPRQEAELARAIPLDRLGFDPNARDALHQLGVLTLGSFLDLPADGVLERFGPPLHALHKLASGQLWAPLVPQPAQEPVITTVRLDHPERDRARLLYLIDELLRGQLAILVQRRQQLQELSLRLLLEDPPARVAPAGDAPNLRHECLRPAQPTLQIGPILELVALRLEALESSRALGSGVLQVELELTGVAAGPDQLELFAENPRRHPRAAAAALARLRALFGDGAVVRARTTEGHLPEARFALEPWAAPHASATARTTAPTAAPAAPPTSAPVAARPRMVLHRPLIRRIFPRPIALSRQRRNEPDGWMILGLEGGPVQEVVGPFTVSGGWWMREVQRDYHYVRTERAGWLWVYFDRRRRRWYAQGAVD